MEPEHPVLILNAPREVHPFFGPINDLFREWENAFVLSNLGAFEIVRLSATFGRLRLVWSGARMVGKPPRKGEHPSE